MRTGAAGVAGDRVVAFTVRYRLTPWWVKVLVIFVVSRIVTTSILLGFAAHQAQNAWTAAKPNYFDFASIWDGHWYYIIAAVGYPTQLPMTSDGHVGESAWAFMPAYPSVVRLVMLGTTLDFPIAAVLVSFAFAAGAALMFYRLMHLVLPGSTALFSVVLFCFAPLSPILQVSYAESMYTFLIALTLYLLVSRRYGLMVPVVAVMSLTRPSGLAFALAMAMHVAWRWWRARKGREVFPVRERVASIGVAFFSLVMGFAWVIVAWILTGSPTAYTDTELAWRVGYIGYQQLLPFTPWLQAAGFWAPWWGMPAPVLIGLLVVGVVGFFALLFTPAVKRLGPDLRFWIASYALYLLAVFFPQSSTFRLLVPEFPLLGALAQPKAWWYRVGIVLLCIAGQWEWIHIAWAVDGYDWTPP